MPRKLFAAAVLTLSTSAMADTGNGEIIGGTAVPAGKWPDAVAVLGQGSCTGTLIAPDVVLTAGHCADAQPTQVKANTTDYAGTGGTTATVKSITAYPNWETTYDVAVIVLNTPIVGVTPRPVGVGCTFTNFANAMQVHLVGFGSTDLSGEGANTRLNEITVPITDKDCANTAAGCVAAIAPGGEFIAGGNNKDSCNGDSGGPVYLDTPNGPVVIGAVSRGMDGAATSCGEGGIYVRTDKVVQWIEQTVGKPVSKDSCLTGGGGSGSGSGSGSGGGTGGGTGGGDGEGEGGGDITGGCSTGGGSGAAAGLFVVLAVLRRRRR
ncbi:MAG TPA: trypsin-like serine protease [Kofleriaceae bacterium]